MKKALLIGILSIVIVVSVTVSFAIYQNKVSAEQSSFRANSGRMQIRDCTLVKSDSGQAVYLITNGGRWGFDMSWDSLKDHILGGNPNIMTISSNELSRYSDRGVLKDTGVRSFGCIRESKGCFFKIDPREVPNSQTVQYQEGNRSDTMRSFPNMEVLNSYNPQNIFLMQSGDECDF